ncbi:MAG: AsnC family transcriptional regulator [Thermoplasmatales archaeon A-plasma]|jgi:DNA-binding Lrp family transcriptional regulator|nr:MAG: AsnC family transcriptional regulator [Thermoplasmatales archaeon A-plasma]
MEETKKIETTPIKLDEIDKDILKLLLYSDEANLKTIADKLKVSKSTVHNRIKRMRDEKFLNGLYPNLDTNKIGDQISAITLIEANYSPNYSIEVGERIARIKGVWAVYYVIGENDFVALIRAKSRDDLERIVTEFSNTEGVERTNTIMALSVIKEDPRDSIIF